jgi:single-strand DNA-binding protein
MRLAVNRSYTTQTGEKREEACFLNVVVWGKQAESCGEYLDKGSEVFVEGRLQTRDWEAKDGQKRTVTEVVAERVQFMSRTKGGRGGAAAPVAVAPFAADDAPGSGGGPDDDVPF